MPKNGDQIPIKCITNYQLELFLSGLFYIMGSTRIKW